MDYDVIIVGAGPGGIFTAYELTKESKGLKVAVFELGKALDKRKCPIDGKKVKSCIKCPVCNIMSGFGGAGAFSDGKLNTRTKDGLNREVLKIFKKFGAPDDILYLNKPHVGSDKLYEVMISLRKFVEENGGEYLFNTKLVGLYVGGNCLKSLKLLNAKTGLESELIVDAAVLAVGHSARDTYKVLLNCGVYEEPRDFAVGVRIEHLADEISFAQYGDNFKLLPTADYQLVSHASDRTVFTFCMCPGGVVIPAASEEGGVVVNGMSMRARDGVNSNSALMVQFTRADFGSDDIFAGVRFQRELERRAFDFGGGNYCAPCQRFGDFRVDRQSSAFGGVKPTYAAGTAFAPLGELLPVSAVNALKAAIPDMGKRLKGFDCADALLTGVETRFSSPVKILRGEDMQSVTVKNLYPVGEGSGYSGGITSSAADGMRAAEVIYKRFA